jgi:AcrR family transcriptional regulator
MTSVCAIGYCDDYRILSYASAMIDTISPVEAPISARAEATRTAIIETAERLFRSMGYQKTAVADIARELRMSPANVYRFFASKAAINEAICARIVGMLDTAAWRIARGPGTASDRLRALFTTMQQMTMDLTFHERRLHDMVNAAMDEHWPVIETFIRSLDTALRHIVMDGQAAGEFAPMDPDLTGRLLHATMAGFTHPTLVQQCIEDDLPAMAAAMAEFCLCALRRQ